MSQWLIERDLGESLGKGGGEKSQGLKKTQVSSEMEGNLHLDISCCSCALRLNQQPLLLTHCSSLADGHSGNERNQKRIC